MTRRPRRQSDPQSQRGSGEPEEEEEVEVKGILDFEEAEKTRVGDRHTLTISTPEWSRPKHCDLSGK